MPAAKALTPAPVESPKVVMLSDIHFDPFADPGKFAALQKASVDQWASILSAPPSKNEAADVAAMQKSCYSKGVDTPYPLLKSALAEAEARQPQPLFVTVSGDLLVHQFDCKYHLLSRQFAADEYSRFAARTVTFVALELKLAFPKVPVYIALGNNDSGCEDYRETPNSMFLVTTAWVAAAAAGQGVNDEIAMEAQHLGDWSTMLPKPLNHTRLIVMQDIFESNRYESCPSSLPPPEQHAAGNAQLSWLKQQLEEARTKHDTVWVMGHIPPGVDPYATIRSGVDVCAGKPPAMFLNSENLLDTLTLFPDTVRLAIFAHTHMDEMRMLTPADGSAGIIPMKMISSISPVNGNNPTVTVASIDTTSASLKDYTVYEASNQTASRWMKPVTWHAEYTYSTAYHKPDYSAASVKDLMNEFQADRSGSSEVSHAYQEHYFSGDTGLSASLKAAAMQLLWPTYACSMAYPRKADFTHCVCKQPALNSEGTSSPPATGTPK